MCISRYVSFSLRGNDCADFAFFNFGLCAFDFSALFAHLCVRAEDRVLVGHGYPVWKWGILGKILQGVAQRSPYFIKLCETTQDCCECHIVSVQAVLLVMSIKLMGQMKRKQEFMALLQSNRYVPGAF